MNNKLIIEIKMKNNLIIIDYMMKLNKLIAIKITKYIILL